MTNYLLQNLELGFNVHLLFQINEKKSEIDAHRNPGGDFGKCVNIDQPIAHKFSNKHSSSCEVIKQQTADVMFSHSADAIMHSTAERERSRGIEDYRCYCLSIFLESVEFSEELKSQKINFW